MARGSLDRIAAIWRSNINELLDQMEDPEKMVRQLVRDMEEEVNKAARAAAGAMANQRRLEREYEGNQTRIRTLQQQAEGAVGEGDEESARRVLERKAVEVSAAAVTGAALEEGRLAAVQLRQQLDELKAGLSEARNRQGALIGRFQATRKQSRSGAGGVEGLTRLEERISDHKNEFERLVQQVETAEAEAEIQQELAAEQRHQTLDPGERVKDELAALKKKVAEKE
jgi:phage shock protein A